MNWSDLKIAFSNAFKGGNNHAVAGSGVLTTQVVEVADFDQIVGEGGFTLRVTQSGAETLTVTTDDNILPHLRLQVANRSLYLKPEPDVNIRPTELVYEVHCKALSQLRVNGGATVNLAEIAGSALTFECNGSARLSGQGTVEKLSLSMNGSGDCDVSELACHECKVHIAGSGDVSVRVASRLSVTILGAGKVLYIGNPTVEKNILGAGSVVMASA